MASTEPGSGWLPAEALDDLETAQDKASEALAERLLALSPRQRVLELMRMAAGKACDTPLRPADLARVLAGFEGAEMPAAGDLCEWFPIMVSDED